MPSKSSKHHHKKQGKHSKKSKDEAKEVAAQVVDVFVTIPSQRRVELQGIATDTVADIRLLLGQHVATCHLTNFGLRAAQLDEEEQQPEHLEESFEIVNLKPCELVIVERDYNYDSAQQHVRRMLDLVSPTLKFGRVSALEEDKLNEARAAAEQQAANLTSQATSGGPKLPRDKKTDDKSAEELAKAAVAAAQAETVVGTSDDCDLHGIPVYLEHFYSFFSMGHLEAPLARIDLLDTPEGCAADEFLFLEVHASDDLEAASGAELVTKLQVTCCEAGFFAYNNRSTMQHSLAALLRCHLLGFKQRYSSLLAAFSERNPFGNLPYALRSNTWVLPPCMGDVHAAAEQLPAESGVWGGSGGGFKEEKGEFNGYAWRATMEALAELEDGTQDARAVRDRRLHLVHNCFVECCARRARKALSDAMEEGAANTSDGNSSIRCTTIEQTAAAWLDGRGEDGERFGAASQKAILKGVVADESSTAKDVDSLAVANVYHAGLKFRLTADRGSEAVKGDDALVKLLEAKDTERGANALNTSSLRYMLHDGTAESVAVDDVEIEASVRDVLCQSLQKMKNTLHAEKGNPQVNMPPIRWELAACWVQRLTEQKEEQTASKGKPAASKKAPMTETTPVTVNDAGEGLADVIEEKALGRLVRSDIGIHRKTKDELIQAAVEYYDSTSLARLVDDFSSLELSPVDGRTLTDFMHTRGLNMRSLGHVAKCAGELEHVKTLCLMEMVSRSVKRALWAVMSLARPKGPRAIASAIACTLNAFLGNAENKLQPVFREWVRTYAKVRFGYDLSEDVFDKLLPLSALRGACQKVGIELHMRKYNFASAAPFDATDIVALTPILKHVMYTSADGRALLESAKTSLDKGALEDAVHFGTLALQKLTYVCGPRHRMAAGAYSLLAVVLYHTGDFSQAAIYQQKALDINERELGLDHPDTMKSYGDLAVFYYRLQHTELARKYVTRALYLLRMTCGRNHPNTAATYINVAMMEEGLGNIQLALRYLHEALKTNQRLLGAYHVQTAASYHAIAIALSLMDAFSLSVQHEQTTLSILESKLGPDDLRTQDAQAWLEYFESKVYEQQEAAQYGRPKPDKNIASKGHLSVKDLLRYITENPVSAEDEHKEVEAALEAECEMAQRRKADKKKSNLINAPVKGASCDSGSGMVSITAERKVLEIDNDSMTSLSSDGDDTNEDVAPEEQVAVKSNPEEVLSSLAVKSLSEDDGEGWEEVGASSSKARRERRERERKLVQDDYAKRARARMNQKQQQSNSDTSIPANKAQQKQNGKVAKSSATKPLFAKEPEMPLHDQTQHLIEQDAVESRRTSEPVPHQVGKTWKDIAVAGKKSPAAQSSVLERTVREEEPQGLDVAVVDDKASNRSSDISEQPSTSPTSLNVQATPFVPTTNVRPPTDYAKEPPAMNPNAQEFVPGGKSLSSLASSTHAQPFVPASKSAPLEVTTPPAASAEEGLSIEGTDVSAGKAKPSDPQDDSNAPVEAPSVSLSVGSTSMKKVSSWANLFPAEQRPSTTLSSPQERSGTAGEDHGMAHSSTKGTSVLQASAVDNKESPDTSLEDGAECEDGFTLVTSKRKENKKLAKQGNAFRSQDKRSMHGNSSKYSHRSSYDKSQIQGNGSFAMVATVAN
mmetsp:Transcript_2040/g.7303  ORF Transcript_2040/g.7303 Transcript_2040/m.7303 type:complete len:1636 (-) Transcript_2040:890-5797(-)